MSLIKNNHQYLRVSIEDSIAVVLLNNPKKTNAINETMWGEIKTAFDELANIDEVKVCIIKSDAKHFSSGIDVNFLTTIMNRISSLPEDEREEALYEQIKIMQESMNAIESCPKPVIAAIHGICVGGAVDLVAACDIRLATYSSMFSIMETKLGIVADMGTLQRLPRIISDTHLKELALSSDFFTGFKAKKIGMVNRNYLTKKALHSGAYKWAKKLATLPSIAVQGTKQTINYGRDHAVLDGLEQVARLNSHLLMSEQTTKALSEIKRKLGR